MQGLLFEIAKQNMSSVSNDNVSDKISHIHIEYLTKVKVSIKPINCLAAIGNKFAKEIISCLSYGNEKHF